MGEVWNCAEIKKNGRTGQNQSGIDIYGIPIDIPVQYKISEFVNKKDPKLERAIKFAKMEE